MQYMDMFNNTIMNKSIAKGVNEWWCDDQHHQHYHNHRQHYHNYRQHYHNHRHKHHNHRHHLTSQSSKFKRTVPQYNDCIHPAMMMTFNLRHVRILNSNSMNKLRNDLMIKGCMTEWLMYVIFTIPIISTILHQVATNCSEWEHSSDRIEPLLHQWLIVCHRLIVCIAYIIDWYRM